MTQTPQKILITGGSGFFGRLLKNDLLQAGYECVSLDVCADEDIHPNLVSIVGSITDKACVDSVFKQHRFDAIFHVAALLAHDSVSKKALWDTNVEGTRLIARCAVEYKVPRIIYTSSNCLFARNFNRMVTEEDTPEPAEIYGRSKWESEKILLSHKADFHSVILRCPTIMAASRLGLFSILYEFIYENRTLWMVGSGDNRYQFIYAGDLIAACRAALTYEGSGIFNIGSDDVKTQRDVYQYVINRSGSRSKLRSLPAYPTIAIMKLCHWLGLSPLGVYHYKMIAESFIFDTTRIKNTLGWQPTQNNEEILLEAYEHYVRSRQENQTSNKHKPAHLRPSRMGIIRLLKWLS